MKTKSKKEDYQNMDKERWIKEIKRVVTWNTEQRRKKKDRVCDSSIVSKKKAFGNGSYFTCV